MAYYNHEEQRLLELENAITAKYGDMSPEEIDRVSAEYETSVMEMFEVIETYKGNVYLNELFYDREVGPVRFPNRITKLLRLKDVFLLTIGFRNNTWRVIWMSPLYVEELFNIGDSSEEEDE